VLPLYLLWSGINQRNHLLHLARIDQFSIAASKVKDGTIRLNERIKEVTAQDSQTRRRRSSPVL
jgi:hypothetical protein